LARIGIYGGTFDPIHAGHLHVVTQVIKNNLVDQLLIVPAGQPLLRKDSPVASPADRRQMCQLALKDLQPEIAAKVSVNPIEILRMGPSYAIDTVEAIKQTFPEDEIVLIIGQDAAEKLDHWHRIDDLRALVEFLVIKRPGFSGDGTDIGAIDVAATSIRQGSSADVSSSVAAFIRENNLYDNK
jgi:nicotinate-nucleotide adenylyltransferase